MYQLCADPNRVCIYFGDDEYEGLDAEFPYTFINGVIRDGDGEEVKLVNSSDTISTVDNNDSVVESVENDQFDPELQELEEDGGGYLSNCDSDSDSDFLFGGDGDKKIVKL